MTVEVELEGTLVARAGARRVRVPLGEAATVADVVAALSEEYGPQVRPAILEGEQLRADTVAVRASPDRERLSSDSRVEPGDTVRFRVRA